LRAAISVLHAARMDACLPLKRRKSPACPAPSACSQSASNAATTAGEARRQLFRCRVRYPDCRAPVDVVVRWWTHGSPEPRPTRTCGYRPVRHTLWTRIARFLLWRIAGLARWQAPSQRVALLCAHVERGPYTPHAEWARWSRNDLATTHRWCPYGHHLGTC